MANLTINPTVFERIIDREIPAEIIYEDGEMLAIKDINPVAPLHVIIFPKRHCKGLDEAQTSHAGTIGRMGGGTTPTFRSRPFSTDRIVGNGGAGR